jgi:Glu-tRNA(Gln) amidotransferase subunit E-like FAD-binding protein
MAEIFQSKYTAEQIEKMLDDSKNNTEEIEKLKDTTGFEQCTNEEITKMVDEIWGE